MIIGGSNWTRYLLTCPHCRKDVVFRVAYKNAQVWNGAQWIEITRSAEAVICGICGHTVFIKSVKKAAQL